MEGNLLESDEDALLKQLLLQVTDNSPTLRAYLLFALSIYASLVMFS